MANHSVFDCITDAEAIDSNTVEVMTLDTKDLVFHTTLDAIKSIAVVHLRFNTLFVNSHHLSKEAEKRIEFILDHNNIFIDSF